MVKLGLFYAFDIILVVPLIVLAISVELDLSICQV